MRMKVILLRSASLLCAICISSAAFAQAVDESALEALDKRTPQVMVPKSEPSGAVELRAAMRRISFNPSDADALADAGNASLALGDANAALNFLTRANALRPGNSRIVSGLAVATVRTENPFEALRLFDDAIRLGANERSVAADRALAFDLWAILAARSRTISLHGPHRLLTIWSSGRRCHFRLRGRRKQLTLCLSRCFNATVRLPGARGRSCWQRVASCGNPQKLRKVLWTRRQRSVLSVSSGLCQTLPARSKQQRFIWGISPQASRSGVTANRCAASPRPFRRRLFPLLKTG